MLIASGQHNLLYERDWIMESIKTYLISVTASAVICSGIISLVGEKGSPITRLLVGIFMTCTILSPLVDIKLENLEYITEGILLEANDAVSVGKNMAATDSRKFITEQYEAYILDKASSLHADVTVSIHLEETGLIDSITIRGQISPYAKAELTKYLTNELGIPEEDQNWTE